MSGIVNFFTDEEMYDSSNAVLPSSSIVAKPTFFQTLGSILSSPGVVDKPFDLGKLIKLPTVTIDHGIEMPTKSNLPMFIGIAAAILILPKLFSGSSR